MHLKFYFIFQCIVALHECFIQVKGLSGTNAGIPKQSRSI